MQFDFATHLSLIKRSIVEGEREGKTVRTVTLQRAYDTDVEDLWDAVTNAERIPRWFLPITGELKLGGKYQLEGNAGGTVTECDKPRYFSATWEFAGGVSWIEVLLAPEGDKASLTLKHICPVDEFWAQYGPGAVGVGWDLGTVGLSVHLAGGEKGDFDETAFATSPEGIALITEAANDWARADIEAGEDPEKARKSARLTAAFYTGQPAPEA